MTPDQLNAAQATHDILLVCLENCDKSKAIIFDAATGLEMLLAENRRMREALEMIADRYPYPILQNIASEALKEISAIASDALKEIEK